MGGFFVQITINIENSTVNIYTTADAKLQAGNSIRPEAGRIDTEFAEDTRLDDRVKGKRQPWREKKTKSLKVVDALHELGQGKKANRMWWCGAELAYQDGKLLSAGFCRDRVCVMCNWRRSIKTFYQLSRVLDIAQDDNPNLETVFLTLAVRNPSGPDLAATLDTMFKGWAKMTEHRRFRNAIVGYFRALEVTYNQATDTYHPHFHVMLVVERKYFHHGEKLYLSQADWVHMWRVSCNLNYDPTAHIQATKTNKERKYKAVAEVAKYTVKDADYVHADPALTVRVVGVLSVVLKNRRLFAFGGNLKVIAKRLGADKPDEGDLVNIDESKAVIRADVANAITVYKWDMGLMDYFRDDTWRKEYDLARSG